MDYLELHITLRNVLQCFQNNTSEPHAMSQLQGLVSVIPFGPKIPSPIAVVIHGTNLLRKPVEALAVGIP
jgi:hypothetical protein